MSADSPRILELRRRVQADPASIAFAQLAEEYRRSGNYDEAIKCCRTGLARHPGYLSARVTLGRALMELGARDEALGEFELVLRTAPDNLAAIRGMAEIHQRRGDLQSALDYYQRALALARHDPELEETVSQIARELGHATPASNRTGLSFAEAHFDLLSTVTRVSDAPQASQDTASGVSETAAEPTPPGPAATPDVEQFPVEPALPSPAEPAVPAPSTSAGEPVDALADFDALLHSLGVPDAAPPPMTEMLLSNADGAVVSPNLVLTEWPTETSSSDPFAALERELRAFDAARAATPPPPPSPHAVETRSATTAILDELEAWLAAIQADRADRQHPST